MASRPAAPRPGDPRGRGHRPGAHRRDHLPGRRGAVTYAVDGATIRVDDGQSTGDTVVRLSRPAWDDMTGQVRTIMNLLLSDDLAFQRGGFEQLADWDPVLRYLHAGIPPYGPARTDLRGRDPFAAFTPDAADAELAAQLETMGYLHHVEGVFPGAEMDAANREVDRLAAAAHPGDDRSWWVTGEDGGRVLCRLVYALPGPRGPRGRPEGAQARHPPRGGNLRVLPGSHGQAVHHRWAQRPATVPVVSIDTAAGDLTVPVQDLMHASPRPTGAGGRRTRYVTYYPPALWEHVGPGQAYNDLVRNRTEQVARLR